jgi:hypothetical protein
MKIQKQNEETGFVQITANSQRRNVRRANNDSEKSGKSIYAGNLNLGADAVAVKRKKAQQKAMKVMADAYKKEKKIDDNLGERQQKIEDMRAENGEALKQISRIDGEKKDLKKAYQVADGSQEQQDLELLEKRNNSKTDRSVVLTTEDRERLKELDKSERTEYQKAILNKDNEKSGYSVIVDKNKKEITNQILTIDAIQKSRLETHPMVDAEKQAKEIVKEANKEVIGMLEAEAKDKMDQDAKAEKQKNEKKEEEEQTEQKEADERKAERMEEDKSRSEGNDKKTEKSTAKNTDVVQTSGSEVTADVVAENMTSQLAQTKQEISTIVNKLNLIKEDLKGAAVDDKA